MSYTSWITVLQLQRFFLSVVSQGVADSRSRFIFIDKGAFGKQSDGGTFSGSTLHHLLEDLESTLPKPASFEESGTEMSFVISADEAYPLKEAPNEVFRNKGYVMCSTCF